MSVNQVSPPVAGTQVLDLQEGPCVSMTQVSQEIPGTQSMTRVSQEIPGTQSKEGPCVSVTQLSQKVPGTQSDKGPCVSA